LVGGAVVIAGKVPCGGLWGRQMSVSTVRCVTGPRYRQPDCTWSRGRGCS